MRSPPGWWKPGIFVEAAGSGTCPGSRR
jgi:hypothetical protein